MLLIYLQVHSGFVMGARGHCSDQYLVEEEESEEVRPFSMRPVQQASRSGDLLSQGQPLQRP